ncbi:MAG: hypothetical protein IKO13_02560, partial [Oscillospiraceae bacterium]|nr:hypothetical protein [Oscillospiraceae bacterium]
PTDTVCTIPQRQKKINSLFKISSQLPPLLCLRISCHRKIWYGMAENFTIVPLCVMIQKNSGW